MSENKKEFMIDENVIDDNAEHNESTDNDFYENYLIDSDYTKSYNRVNYED